MKQQFRKIPSLDFRYEVSRDGIVRNVKSKKIKKQFITKFGYYRTNYAVNKTNPHYKGKYGWDRPVHQLVMECWGQPQPSEKHIIDHIDRNKLNNNIENLRWVTYSQNALNQDKELVSARGRLGQLNSVKKKRNPVKLINKKTREEFVFNSRFRAALWLIENKYTQTKLENAKGLSRAIQVQKYTHGFEIHNINAERPDIMS